ATQILAGSHIIDTQLRRQRCRAHAIEDSKVDTLGLPPDATETPHDQVVIIPTSLESSNHLGVAGERREDDQLELETVDVEKNPTIRSTKEAPELRVGRNILQTWVTAGVTPSERPAGMQLTMQPPVDDMTGKCRTERRQTAHLLGPCI